MNAAELLPIAAIGLGAGVLGGLAGVGGSMLILPALGLILGYPDPKGSHHLYMAAAMATNLVVSIPAAWRHWHAGAVRTDLVGTLVVATGSSLAAGVVISNRVSGWSLMLMLAGFQVCYCAWTLWLVARGLPEPGPEGERVTRGRLVGSAGATGLTAGLLGLGGGVLQVPLLQVLCGLRLRQAIGTSSAVICLTAVVGAGLKLWALPGLVQTAGSASAVGRALELAAMMTPGAVIGALLGATLTHKLPLAAVRVLIVTLLLASAATLVTRGGRAAGWW
jgi:hypothetical protein